MLFKDYLKIAPIIIFFLLLAHIPSAITKNVTAGNFTDPDCFTWMYRATRMYENHIFHD